MAKKMTMKKLKVLIFLLFLATISKAQITTEFTVGGGYAFNGKNQFKEGVVDIKNGPNLNFSVEFENNNTQSFQIDYNWCMNPTFEFRSHNLFTFSDFDAQLDIHNISFNFLHYFVDGEKIKPFLGIGMGTAFFNFRESEASNPVRFSYNIASGFKYFVGSKLGLKLSVKYVGLIIAEGVGIHAGIGTGVSGAGISVYATNTFNQCNLSGGLVYKL
jgi:hypothetical protein